MTLANFKTITEIKLKGDKKAPETNTEYNLLIKESIQNICDKTIPVDLIETDTNITAYRWINSTQFIRYPNDVSLDADTIDIDEQLIYAVIYDLVSVYTGKLERMQIATAKRDEIISNYEWNNYKFLNELGLIEETTV